MDPASPATISLGGSEQTQDSCKRYYAHDIDDPWPPDLLP